VSAFAVTRQPLPAQVLDVPEATPDFVSLWLRRCRRLLILQMKNKNNSTGWPVTSDESSAANSEFFSWLWIRLFYFFINRGLALIVSHLRNPLILQVRSQVLRTYSSFLGYESGFFFLINS
jgi:hypothetical protein